MKKIDEWTVETMVYSGAGVYCNDNTVIHIIDSNNKSVELFGNCIYKNGIFTMASYNTQTTRARLNAILRAISFKWNIVSRGGCACPIIAQRNKKVYFSGAHFVELDPNAKYKIVYDEGAEILDIEKL